jgi:hypothetical protein
MVIPPGETFIAAVAPLVGAQADAYVAGNPGISIVKSHANGLEIK